VHNPSQERNFLKDVDLHQIDEKIVLARKIRIESTLRAPGGRANATDRDRRDAFLHNRCVCGFQELFACLTLGLFSVRRHFISAKQTVLELF